MKKLNVFAILILVFALGTFVEVTVWRTFAERIFLSTKSPSETFTVEIVGDRSRRFFPFIEHKATFNLYKDNQPQARNVEFYSGDLFDSDFSEFYPRYKWLNDSILWFGSDINQSEKSTDSLVISNKTNNVIKYLKINTQDKILVFNLHPNSKLQIPFLRRPYFSAQGEFENGKPVRFSSINFPDKEISNLPEKLCLSVVDDSLKIESTTRKGYTSDTVGDNENTNVPKVESCF